MGGAVSRWNCPGSDSEVSRHFLDLVPKCLVAEVSGNLGEVTSQQLIEYNGPPSNTNNVETGGASGVDGCDVLGIA